MDLVVAGMPWDTIKREEEFNNLPDNRKSLSRSFYDVDDELINSVFTHGFDLLNINGKMFITASDRIINRIKSFCLKHHLNYQIVEEANLHNDGNLHYILEISKI